MREHTIHHTRHDAFELLREPIRLRILFELACSDEPVDFEELVTAIRRRESTQFPDISSPPPETEAVRTALHHAHLPKIADAGWIEYDPDSQRGDYELRATEFTAALRTAEEELEALRTAFEERSV